MAITDINHVQSDIKRIFNDFSLVDIAKFTGLNITRVFRLSLNSNKMYLSELEIFVSQFSEYFI